MTPTTTQREADPMQTVTLVEILPTRIWIEDGICGERVVCLQHEGCEPFDYAVFNYSYAYTCNAGTWEAARNLALSLGATEPIERRHRGFPPFRWWHRVMVWFWQARRAVAAGIRQRKGE